MKLEQLIEFTAVPSDGQQAASRMTPVTFRNMAPPLPDEMYSQFEDEETSNKATDHFITDIEQDTLNNKYFRRVLYTATNCQLVVMSIRPGQDIGEEIHESIDQFFRVEKGKGKVVFNGEEHGISDGSGFIVPQGTKHNIINTGRTDLKLYTIYSPPNHMKDTVHKTKADAEANEEHFDGDADTQ